MSPRRGRTELSLPLTDEERGRVLSVQAFVTRWARALARRYGLSAEELEQDIWLEACYCARRFDPRRNDSFEKFLFQRVKWVAKDALRRLLGGRTGAARDVRRERPITQYFADNDRSVARNVLLVPDPSFEQMEARRDLELLGAILPDRLRHYVRRRAAGLRQAEVAREMGVTNGRASQIEAEAFALMRAAA